MIQEKDLAEITASILKNEGKNSARKILQRYLVGVAGPPGAGKSTFAADLCRSVNEVASKHVAKVVPMDGFHLDNSRLEQMGLLHLKGIPDTFDKEGFEALVTRLKTLPAETIFFPVFDRSIEASIQDADSVGPDQPIVILEGNYLFYWHQIRNQLDLSIYIDAPEDILYERLIARHLEGGKDTQSARDKVLSTDMPNRNLVQSCRDCANIFLDSAKGVF